jgi:hypothetical protein
VPSLSASQPRSWSRRWSSNPAVPEAELEVAHHHVGMGEVDDRLDADVEQLLQVVVRVDPGDEVHVLGVLDRRTHLTTDLAQRAQHAHLETHGPQASGRQAGPTWASVWGRV